MPELDDERRPEDSVSFNPIVSERNWTMPSYRNILGNMALEQAVNSATRSGRVGSPYRPQSIVTEFDIEPTPVRDSAQEESVFVEHIRMALGNGEPISSKQAKKYVEIVRKHRHIDQIERRMLHKPKQDKNKRVANCNVDDLCLQTK